MCGTEKPVSEEISSELIKRAVEFHGHLGPFLVLGLRMSKKACRFLKQVSSVEVKTRLKPPRSCILDGIQIVTKCTLGNTNLKFLESPSEISGEFRDQDKKIVIECKKSFLDKLESQMRRKERPLEEMALNILKIDEDEIFDIKKME
ncbi:MAG: FmdE family protein [Candidatus Jordarchaeum sp.]|uniref:FmdE family protein n=1 Tax=Candidatus Jordarchaeum sp. TaxID=2823881 RepID=UPI0040495060